MNYRKLFWDLGVRLAWFLAVALLLSFVLRVVHVQHEAPSNTELALQAVNGTPRALQTFSAIRTAADFIYMAGIITLAICLFIPLTKRDYTTKN